MELEPTYEDAMKPPPTKLHHTDCRWYPERDTGRQFPAQRSAYWACSSKCAWYWPTTINNMARP